MQRRRFLLLFGGTATGIVIAGGFIALPGKMVLAMGGECSFCGKPALEVFGLAGVVGREHRVCDQCIALCLDIMSEEDQAQPAGSELSPDLLEDFGARFEGKPGKAEFEEEWKRLLEALPHLDLPFDMNKAVADPPVKSRARKVRPVVLACSFCDEPQQKVKKLIAGPSTYICDTCIGNAAITLRVYRA